MIIDTSASLAILRNEPETAALWKRQGRFPTE
jgi:uncharacterized protein with PIN domain